ncbi:hypothetical protein JCM1840_005986 [Sporobolomyces johnsonii]
MRPPPGLVTSVKEVAARSVTTATKGGASKQIRAALKFQRALHPHSPSKSTATNRSPRPSFGAALDSFFQSVYSGVFHTVRSSVTPRAGPYTAQRLAARPSPSPAFRSGFSSSVRPSARPSSRFGPTPRPVPHPAQASHLGLGAARSFSSSGFAVFENIVHNAPLGLRALADHGMGIDERKWRSIKREIRKSERTDVKGKGAFEGSERLRERQADFAQYFAGVESAAVEEEAESDAEPVTLYFVVDPELPFASTSSDSSSAATTSSVEFDPSYRLLPTSVLTAFTALTQSYTSHAHRLRALINRLSAAGLLDDPSSLEAGMCVDVESGKRVWRVVFRDGFVTRSRVESVLRGDDDETGGMYPDGSGWEAKVTSWTSRRAAPGEGQWWWIASGDTAPSSLDLDDVTNPAPSTYLYSPGSSSVETSFSDDDDDDEEEIAPSHTSTPSQSFVLPDPIRSSSVSSLDLTPPLSPSLDATSDWDAWDLHSSSASLSGRPDSPFAFGGPEVDDVDASAWWAAESDEETASGSWSGESGEYEEDEDGVKQFLDEIERERARLGTTWQ